MSNENKGNSKLLAGIVIGGVIGTTLSLMDRTTRTNAKVKVQQWKDSTNQLVHELRENPAQVKQDTSEKLHYLSDTMREVMNDSQTMFQHIQNTINARTQDLKEIAGDFKQLYFQSKRQYQSIQHKLQETKSQIGMNTNSSNDSELLPVVAQDHSLIEREKATL
ncbi:YtxH domain-containing protein [Niallia taxi]|uniref:YtxH domain-containing protein n=1 Tax=Niallia taxi TaxID=2499688 RepID=UPI0011A5EC87|nr:YtxH domain-containing protein [Niallia taxi]MCT2343765.1 hypothetical protein [Niallia taxi]MED3965394.1 YtxH domain-containing protein [Niallia taxi]WOD62782.1 hypothetical protein NQZ71_18810 [Niallia taxi]